MVLLATSGVLFAFAPDSTRASQKQLTEYQRASIVRTANLVRGRSVPGSWSGGVFLSEDGINELLNGLAGSEIRYDPATRPDEDTTFTVKSAHLDFSPGVASGTISFTARSEVRKIQADFKAEATLVFRQFSTKDGKTYADFYLNLGKISGDISWISKHFLNLKLNGWAAELLATGVSAYLNNNLPLSVPLPNIFGLNSEASVVQRLPTGEPKSDNFADVRVSTPKYIVRNRLVFEEPIVTGRGLWIVADVGAEDAIQPPQFKALSSVTDKEVAAAQRELRSLNELNASSDFATWINSKAFETIIGAYAKSPDAVRTVTVQSTKVAGNFAAKKWRDNLLGSGGAFARFGGDGALNGSMLIKDLSAGAAKDGGVAVSGRLQMHTDSNIHVHVDPLVGGGAGTGAKLFGDAEIGIATEVRTDVVKVDGHQLAVWQLGDSCEPVSIGVKTDGVLKINGVFRADVPALSGKFTGRIGAGSFPQQLLFSDVPYVISGRAPDGKPITASFGGQTYSFKPQWAQASISVLPQKASIRQAGFLISSQLKIDYDPKDVSPLPRDQRDATLSRKLAAAAPVKPCIADWRLTMALGDISFFDTGPFNKAMHELSPEKLKEWIKDPVNSFARSDVGKATSQVLDSSGKIVQDAGKIGQQVITEAPKVVTQTITEAPKVVTRTINEGTKAIQKKADDIKHGKFW
ncbi:hypothetical protein [Rhizobium sp. 42MFCr.1]|uniref:hypothetical protein n=1 Tax=Rhizobium sp. 42MFCr.1 TaxID=1048680 RepID=UPI0012EC9E9D|nr:hypothetical protein [Rhizobium sp. 42MFCr.1]